MRGNTRVAHQVPALDQDRYDALFFVCSFWLQNWRFSCLKIGFFGSFCAYLFESHMNARHTYCRAPSAGSGPK